jgi:hypothetical protein
MEKKPLIKPTFIGLSQGKDSTSLGLNQETNSIFIGLNQEKDLLSLGSATFWILFSLHPLGI